MAKFTVICLPQSDIQSEGQTESQIGQKLDAPKFHSGGIKIIRDRATATLGRPQIKQYIA